MPYRCWILGLLAVASPGCSTAPAPAYEDIAPRLSRFFLYGAEHDERIPIMSDVLPEPVPDNESLFDLSALDGISDPADDYLLTAELKSLLTLLGGEVIEAAWEERPPEGPAPLWLSETAPPKQNALGHFALSAHVGETWGPNDFRPEGNDDPELLVDAARVLFAPANLFVEGMAALLLPERVTVNGQVLMNRSGGGDFATIFTRTVIKRERNYFGGFQNSELSTLSVEEGTSDIDRHRFDNQQVKVIVDSLKRSYRERFQVPALDLDTAVSTLTTGTWFDTLLVPTVISAYTVRFGMDRKFRPFEDVQVGFRLESGSRVYDSLSGDSSHAIGSVWINLFNLPISAICSLEGDSGSLEFGFVGIGTDLSAALEATYASAVHGTQRGR